MPRQSKKRRHPMCSFYSCKVCSLAQIPKVATPRDPTSSTFLLEPSMLCPTLPRPLCHIPHVHCLRRRSTGWPIPTQEGSEAGAECHRINVTQMALTRPDPVTSIGFPQPQRAGRLVSLPAPQPPCRAVTEFLLFAFFWHQDRGCG